MIAIKMKMPTSCYGCPLAEFSLIDGSGFYCVATKTHTEANVGRKSRASLNPA